MNLALPDVLIALAACEHRGNYSAPCHAIYVEPLGGRGFDPNQIGFACGVVTDAHASLV